MLVFILLAYHFLQAQNGDTLRHTQDFLTNRLEDLARSSDRQQDYSDLAGDYLYYARHPININSDEVEKLLKLNLLNEMQLTALKNYIHQYGLIYSVFELRYISGFNAGTLQRLLPFITVGKPKATAPFSFKRALRYADNQVLARYGQILEKAQGYKMSPDSAYLKPGSVFLGPPQSLYLRYGLRADDHLRFGFTTEKDAGEVLFPSRLGDSVKTVLGSQKPRFPDFFSAYAYLANLGIVKKVILGDYHLEFGQGLCLWSGLTFGKSAEATDINYYGSGIRPNTSVNENRFFRGIAVTLGKNNLAVTLFYSHNKVDGSFFINPDSRQEISGLLETGNHRTISELQNKHRVAITAFGGHLAYVRGIWRTGVTFYQTRLSLPLEPAAKLYKIAGLRGKQWNNASVNSSLRLNRLFFFGELAANPGGSFAGMAGLNAYPSDRLWLTLAYRNFSPGYKVLYASPFMESGRANNEQGLYFGTKILLSGKFTFSAYADFFKFPWLKYHINAPSFGKAFLAQLDMVATAQLSMYFRVRYTQKEENYLTAESYSPILVNKSLSDFRFALTYSPDAQLTLKSRLEFVRYAKKEDYEQGFLAFQDVIVHFIQIPLTLNFRYALFDTDGWNSRIYAYESDVLYAFTIPPYYDKGQRAYLLIHYKLRKHFELWMKMARTWFFNKDHISSGPEMLDSNHKTSIRVQVQIKF